MGYSKQENYKVIRKAGEENADLRQKAGEENADLRQNSRPKYNFSQEDLESKMMNKYLIRI